MSDRRLVHTSRMSVRWGDMDAFGHVNNTVYFRYMEQTRIEWLQAIAADAVADGLGPVIVNAQCTFLRQLKYPAALEIRMHAKEPGRSSLETTYEIRCADRPEIIYADGGAKMVWIDLQRGKSVPLPDGIRQSLTDL